MTGGGLAEDFVAAAGPRGASPRPAEYFRGSRASPAGATAAIGPQGGSSSRAPEPDGAAISRGRARESEGFPPNFGGIRDPRRRKDSRRAGSRRLAVLEA